MIKTIDIENISQMSIPERVLLVEDIWDSIAKSRQNISIPEEHKAILDKRFEAFKSDPTAGSSWEDVKERILTSK